MINLKFSNIKEPFYDVLMNDAGNIYYYNRKGQLHNLIGPAIEYASGFKAYYVNNKLHRTDGPAVEGVDGYEEYWVNDKQLSKEEFDKLIKKIND